MNKIELEYEARNTDLRWSHFFVILVIAIAITANQWSRIFYGDYFNYSLIIKEVLAVEETGYLFTVLKLFYLGAYWLFIGFFIFILYSVVAYLISNIRGLVRHELNFDKHLTIDDLRVVLADHRAKKLIWALVLKLVLLTVGLLVGIYALGAWIDIIISSGVMVVNWPALSMHWQALILAATIWFVYISIFYVAISFIHSYEVSIREAEAHNFSA